MTLVLSVLTRDYVVQVSDRRLIDSRTREVFTDQRNKAVVVCGRYVFSYTGVAEIGPQGQPTDEWLVENLSDPDVSITDAVREVATKAAERLDALGLPPILKSQAFVGVGWADVLDGPQPGLHPVLVVTSNFLDAKSAVRSKPADVFDTHFLTLGGEHRFWLHEAGQPLSKDRRKDLEDRVGTIAKRGNSRAMAQELMQTIRSVAEENAAVGDSLLVSVIHKNDVPLPKEVSAAPRKDMESMFAFSRGRSDDELSFYGPNFTCEGAIIEGIAFEVRPRQ